VRPTAAGRQSGHRQMWIFQCRKPFRRPGIWKWERPHNPESLRRVRLPQRGRFRANAGVCQMYEPQIPRAIVEVRRHRVTVAGCVPHASVASSHPANPPPDWRTCWPIARSPGQNPAVACYAPIASAEIFRAKCAITTIRRCIVRSAYKRSKMTRGE